MHRLFPIPTQKESNCLRQSDLIQDVAEALIAAYKRRAKSEALKRALCRERADDGEKARFWAKVYLELGQTRNGASEQTKARAKGIAPPHRPDQDSS